MWVAYLFNFRWRESVVPSKEIFDKKRLILYYIYIYMHTHHTHAPPDNCKISQLQVMVIWNSFQKLFYYYKEALPCDIKQFFFLFSFNLYGLFYTNKYGQTNNNSSTNNFQSSSFQMHLAQHNHTDWVLENENFRSTFSNVRLRTYWSILTCRNSQTQTVKAPKGGHKRRTQQSTIS